MGRCGPSPARACPRAPRARRGPGWRRRTGAGRGGPAQVVAASAMSGCGPPGVDHEHVDRPEALGDRRHEPVDRGPVGHVGGEAAGPLHRRPGSRGATASASPSSCTPLTATACPSRPRRRAIARPRPRELRSRAPPVAMRASSGDRRTVSPRTPRGLSGRATGCTHRGRSASRGRRQDMVEGRRRWIVLAALLAALVLGGAPAAPACCARRRPAVGRPRGSRHARVPGDRAPRRGRRAALRPAGAGAPRLGRTRAPRSP